MDGTPATGREYLRVSQDKSGRKASVTEQHDENVRATEAAGITLGEPYRENGSASASRYARKARDDFARLLQDLESGDFGADHLVLWESSRGSRRVGEWVTLIELAEAAKVRFFVTSHGPRIYNPANARDRRSLLEDAVDSEYEVAKTSDRLRRAAAASAAAGRPHGRAPYGFRRVHDPRTGALVGWEHDPVEGPIKRELYERIRSGHSMRTIARDFEVRGIVNRSGTPFTSAHLHSLVKPADIGKRVHHGELLTGTWEPLVAEELYYSVRRILDDPTRKTSRHGRAVHEFTMIIKCDVCSGPMAIAMRSRSRNRKPGETGPPRYTCRTRGCTHVLQSEVDEILRATIFAYLARDDVHEMITAKRGDDPEVRRLEDELARLRAELDEAENTTPETVHHAKTLGKLVEKLTADIATADGKLRELTLPPALVDLVEPGADVAARWADTPLPARRKIAEILLSPRYLGEVRIKRSAVRHRPTPAVDRLEWRRE